MLPYVDPKNEYGRVNESHILSRLYQQVFGKSTGELPIRADVLAARISKVDDNLQITTTKALLMM